MSPIVIHAALCKTIGLYLKMRATKAGKYDKVKELLEVGANYDTKEFDVVSDLVHFMLM